MVCGGSQSSSNVYFLTLFNIGLFFSHVQASGFVSVNCNIAYTFHQHCGFHPGGVRNLDCFSRRGRTGTKSWKCEWQPGISTSKTTYTLFIQQENYCKICNTTGKNRGIEIFERKNMTAFVVENPELQNCTKAIFKGTPKSLNRCGPPHKVSFYRHFGILNVNVTWLQQDTKAIQGYLVRYKAVGELLWTEISSQIKSGWKHIVNSLNSHVAYEGQIKCAINNRCTQCPWSDTYTIPPELRMQPVLTALEDVDSTVTMGSRLVSLTWKTDAKEKPDGYYLTIKKASGEPPSEHLNTNDTKITLNLSFSAYIVNISAVNNASVSPALSQTIKRREDILTGMEAGKLNVTVHSNTSFTVYWRAHLLKNYVCYSVEWSEKQHRAAYLSFFENVQSRKTLDIPEPLEPYKRYSLSLHTRPNKETCNIKHINNSESTYGRTHFYFMEGSPISAPTNVSCHNVTSTSIVLQWSPIPEEDLRGFLLGYIIYYKEYNNREAHIAEKDVTVSAELTRYEMKDLNTGTGYKVQISGFTRAGTGVRSITSFFKTYKQVYLKDSVIIFAFAVIITVLIFASPILKRTKLILWPSVPNPENSNAIRKIEKSFEVELLESLQTLKVEEWDTNSLQIVEEAQVLFAAEEKADSPEMVSERTQKDINKDIIFTQPADIEQKGLSNTQPAFTCGYTTMEMFQQAVMSQCTTSITKDTEARVTELDDLVVIKPGFDYVGQICSSPVFDMSTSL